MNKASLDWEADVDEFEITGLTPLYENLVVRPPRVAQSPAQLECRLAEILPLGDYHFVIGEVVAFHRRKDLCANRSYVDQNVLDAIGRLAGSSYCYTSHRFTLQRNADSPELKTRSDR
jgi:flavin reductase (DIM6/NTAB) family NADH-FMN oxidoreductase RutF